MAVDKEELVDSRHVARDRRQIFKWVVPYLGNEPIGSIEAPEPARGPKAYRSQRRHRHRAPLPGGLRTLVPIRDCTGRAKHDIAADLIGAPRAQNHAASCCHHRPWQGGRAAKSY